jgi:SAM-dependent methyltransferase
MPPFRLGQLSLNPIRFRCPSCEEFEALSASMNSCSHCGAQYVAEGGVLNLVRVETDRADEQAFYNSVYGSPTASTRRAVEDCVPLWGRREQPELAIVRRELGDLAGKDVLLLGNGASQKELAFLLDRPRTLVYSDLSPQAGRRMRESYDLDEHLDRIVFAALDAQELPFGSESFDVVYAYAMVHHLPKIDQFIREVHRVLRPGGRAIFMDDAYAPIWHAAKQTWLRPLMKYSHRRTGISPEDYRFSMSGGFKEGDLKKEIEAVGAEPWFVRTSFITYVAFRGIEKLLPRRLSETLKTSWLPSLTTGIDNLLGRVQLFRANQIRLIWGFGRPSRA